jgi:hypothetical protein
LLGLAGLVDCSPLLCGCSQRDAGFFLASEEGWDRAHAQGGDVTYGDCG